MRTFAAVSLLWFCLPVLGQDGRIAGRVTTPGLEPLQAAVIVTQPDSGFRRMVLSDPLGRFAVPSLPPGTYRLEALAPGFQPTESTVQLGSFGVSGVSLYLGPGADRQAASAALACKAGEPMQTSLGKSNCLDSLLVAGRLLVFWH